MDKVVEKGVGIDTTLPYNIKIACMVSLLLNITPQRRSG